MLVAAVGVGLGRAESDDIAAELEQMAAELVLGLVTAAVVAVKLAGIAKAPVTAVVCLC